jgi:hypothetical protein
VTKDGPGFRAQQVNRAAGVGPDAIEARLGRLAMCPTQAKNALCWTNSYGMANQQIIVR